MGRKEKWVGIKYYIKMLQLDMQSYRRFTS